MSNPYMITESAMKELHSRTNKRINQLFPEGPPSEVVKRIKREEEELRSNPYTYALLITHEVIQELHYHRFSANLEGDWFCSYYAYLLEMTIDDPIELASYYKSMGFRTKQLVRDGCNESPIQIEISPGWGKSACLELLKQCAKKWDFWLAECQEGGWKLINRGFREDDIFAARAPIIQII